MELDGAQAEPEHGNDLLVRVATEDALEDVNLAARKTSTRGGGEPRRSGASAERRSRGSAHPRSGAPCGARSAVYSPTSFSQKPGMMPISRMMSGQITITNNRPGERVGANGCEASRKYIAVTIRR
jgi:hypothetical protein